MNVSVVLHQAQAEMAESTAPVASTAAIAARSEPVTERDQAEPQREQEHSEPECGLPRGPHLGACALTVLVSVQMVRLRQPQGGAFEDLTHEERGHVRGDDDWRGPL